MPYRLACPADLPRLEQLYRDSIRHMETQGIRIWDQVYPCCVLPKDIADGRLHVQEEAGQLRCAFSLCPSDAGEKKVDWEKSTASALYIARLAVSPAFLGQGLGASALQEAIALSRAAGAEYLRLFVGKENRPAIRLYLKLGFRQAAGTHTVYLEGDWPLAEWGFEIATGAAKQENNKGNEEKTDGKN